MGKKYCYDFSQYIYAELNTSDFQRPKAIKLKQK